MSIKDKEEFDKFLLNNAIYFESTRPVYSWGDNLKETPSPTNKPPPYQPVSPHVQQMEQQSRMFLQTVRTTNVYTPTVPNMVTSTGSCVGTPTFSKPVDCKCSYATSFVPPNGEQNVPHNVEVKKPTYTSSI